GEHRHLHALPTRRSSDLKVDKIKKDAQKVIEYVNNPKNQEAVKEFKKNAYNLTKKVGGQVTDAVKAGTRVYERYVRLKRRLIMRSEEHTSELQSRENLVC